MSKRPLAKKDSDESEIIQKESDLSRKGIYTIIRRMMGSIAEPNQLSPMIITSIVHEFGHVLAHENLKKLSRESASAYEWIYAVLAMELHSTGPLYRAAGVEKRLMKLEKLTSIHSSWLEKLEDRIGPLELEEEEKEKQWPEYASEEFEKIIENCSALEDSGEDTALILYHIMEIETLLGRIEKKARITKLEYEARLSASLRDICRIHEPCELSDEQIKCFTGSIQALIEGWGLLNREKVKWIRGRLLEVGLTWLPVTEKAQKVIDEAKSSVK